MARSKVRFQATTSELRRFGSTASVLQGAGSAAVAPGTVKLSPHCCAKIVVGKIGPQLVLNRQAAVWACQSWMRVLGVPAAPPLTLTLSTFIVPIPCRTICVGVTVAVNLQGFTEQKT